MKQIFFFGVLIVLPVILIGGGIMYLVWHTCYALSDNWQFTKSLEETGAASRANRSRQDGTHDA